MLVLAGEYTRRTLGMLGMLHVYGTCKRGARRTLDVYKCGEYYFDLAIRFMNRCSYALMI